MICGNGIAEMEGKKNCGNWFVAIELPKWEKKKYGSNWFVAMLLPKIGGGKKRIVVIDLCNGIAEMEEKKNCGN